LRWLNFPLVQIALNLIEVNDVQYHSLQPTKQVETKYYIDHNKNTLQEHLISTKQRLAIMVLKSTERCSC
jgi:hypothetical protein